MTAPAVSVVLSVYNGADTVAEAVRSILDQTLRDLELVVLDDGSRDATPAILARLAAQDPRLRVIRQENTGLTRALNRGVAAARAPLIARQDADDISLPGRLAAQVDFLARHPEIALLGTGAYEEGPGGRVLVRPVERGRLGQTVFLHNPFVHTSVMFRKARFEALGGYDETFDTSQDFELWMRFAEAGGIDMLAEPLVVRRQRAGSISAKRRWRQYRNGLRARLMHPRAGLAQALRASAYHVLSNSAPDWLVAAVRRSRRLD